MKLYKLPLVIHQPSEETEDRLMAEVPSIPGCRAWGDTPTEVMENLQSVAAGFIDSYSASGDPLPAGVEAISTGESRSQESSRLQFELPRINPAIVPNGL